MDDILIFDTEVFRHGWLLCATDGLTGEEYVIWNDREALLDFYNKHRNGLWIGYNVRGYDQYILKAIILGMNPYDVSHWIVKKGLPGWKFAPEAFQKVPLNFYDVQFNRNVGLKQLEGFMGLSIEESSVDFDLDRPLTQEEIDMTIHYCKHDVDATIEVLNRKMSSFSAQLDIVTTFKRPRRDMCKTLANLAAKILEAKPRKFDDEFDLRLPENLKVEKYTEVLDFYANAKELTTIEMKAEREKLEAEMHLAKTEKALKRLKAKWEKTDWTNPDKWRDWFYGRELVVNIDGVDNKFAWGGLHGARKKYFAKTTDDEVLLMADVDQLYPSLMVHYNIISRAVKHPERLRNLLETSLRLKAEGKKEEREPYKLICNITYGASGAEFNSMHDPLHRNLVCVFGQLFILDLCEKVSDISVSLQNNTDGIFVKLKRSDVDEFKRRVHEWEERTHLHMSFEEYAVCSQKDVNNYIIISKTGKVKAKGAYTKVMDDLSNNMMIVRDALIAYIVDGTPPEVTINACDDFLKFQAVVRAGDSYDHMYHNGKKHREKVMRVFASKSKDDGALYKVREDGSQEKVGNTPERCFINNRKIIGRKCPPKLDKQYYIDMAYKRYKDYMGVKK